MAQIDTLTNVGAVVSTDLALILRGGANVLGTLGSMVGQNSSAVTITGGTINGTTIGATTPASVAATTLSTTGDISLPDNAKAIFGAGSDLQILHDGSNSYIQSTTGNLNFTTAGGAEFAVTAANNGAVTLFHDGSTKLATTATGIDVTGTVTADGLTVENSLSGATNVFNLQNTSNTANSNSRLKIATGGTSGGDPILQLTDNASNWYVFGDQSDSFKFKIGTSVTDNKFVIDNGGDISFYEDTGTTAKFFWDASAESLGIGTSSPSQKLTVEGSAGYLTTIQTTDANSPRLQVYIDDTDGVSFVSGYDTTAKGMQFFTGGANRLRLDASGNLGLGVVPSAWGSSQWSVFEGAYGGALAFYKASNVPVTVLTSNAFNDGVWKYKTTDPALQYEMDGNVGIHKWYNAPSGTAGDPITFTQAMTLDASGNLLVGTTATVGTSPAKLEILGDAGGGRCINTKTDITTSANAISFNNGNGQVGSITTNGSATAYNTSSDQRLKENIADADDAGSKIDAIQVRQFDWKADGSHQNYGMIAQELQVVAPEAVSGDADSEEMMGVDYSKLVPMMLKEIQSLRARISQLEGAN